MRLLLFLMFIAILLLLPLIAGANDLKRQTNCPVMGLAVDESLYVDKDGKRIYVCCGGCIGEVKENFDKYAGQLEDKGYNIGIEDKTD